MEQTTVPAIAGSTGESSVLQALARVTAPLARPLAGRRFFPLWAVMHTRGRRSGRELAIPVVVRRTSVGFVIPLPFGDGTQWVRNVIAADGCSVRWAGEDHALVQPEVVGFDEVADAFSPFQRWALPRIGAHRFIRLRDREIG
jgi:hypothetical protein